MPWNSAIAEPNASRSCAQAAVRSTSRSADELLAFDMQVGEEDVALVESVQRGLDSATVNQGRLLPESEQLIADFQRRVRDALLS